MAGTSGTTFDGAVEGVGEVLAVGKMVAPGPKAVDVRKGVNRDSEAENEDENVLAETDVADSELGTIELDVALAVEEKGKLDEELNVVDIATGLVELDDWVVEMMEEVLKKEEEAVSDGAVAVNVRFVVGTGIID
jgi:hypothetical protein